MHPPGARKAIRGLRRPSQGLLTDSNSLPGKDLAPVSQNSMFLNPPPARLPSQVARAGRRSMLVLVLVLVLLLVPVVSVSSFP